MELDATRSPDPGAVALSFNELCLPHRKTLLARASRLTSNYQRAQDLVQDTYVQAFTHWDRFQIKSGEDPLRYAGAWLRQILMNVFISAYRRMAVRYESTCSEHHSYSQYADMVVSNFMSGGEDHVRQIKNTAAVRGESVSQISHDPRQRQMLRVWLERELSKLDPDTVAIVVRADIFGDSYGEIAERLQVSVGAVRSRLHRARRRMLSLLRDEGSLPAEGGA